MNILRRIDRVLDTVFDNAVVWVANILLYIILVIMFVEVITRYVFGISHVLSLEYCVFFGLWMGFLYTGKLTRDRFHIAITLLPDTLAKRQRVRAGAIVDLVIHLSMVGFAVLAIYFGVINTITLYTSAMGTVFPYTPRYWLYSLVLPVFGFFLLYYEAREIVRGVCALPQTLSSKGGETC